MAFTVINANEVEVGDPVTASLGTKIKDNFDDHEARILAVEALQNKVIVFMDTFYNAAQFTDVDDLIRYNATFDFTLTEAKIYIFTKGSLTGTLELDVKKNSSLNPAGFSSVFTTKPSIDYSTISNYGSSTNQVLDATAKNISAGDWLKVDITEMPGGGIVGKYVFVVYGEI
jgi:hypothetical protein